MTSQPVNSLPEPDQVERAADARPATLGEWELIGLLGEGLLTQVYRARPSSCLAGDPAESAGYAVKLLKPKWERDPQAIEILRREVHVGRKVSHPHLVPVLASNLRQFPLFLVTPYLPGRSLADRLAQQLPSLPQALWYARQTAEALAALHLAGWLHTDVKPANIMVSHAGHVTLVDLGFARGLEEVRSELNRPLLGSPAYLAPELFTSALVADPRSDLYSLGVILYELLTGQLPSSATSLQDLAAWHRQGTYRDIRSLVPQIPLHVAELVRSLLAREPLRRPQSALEFARRLAALEIETLPAWAA